MDAEPSCALHLRLRGREPVDAPPDVDAFRRSPASEATARMRRAEVAVLPGDRPLQPGAPLLLFFAQVEFGIPAPGFAAALPDLGHWSLRPTVFGYLAAVSRPAPGTRPRATWVIAACLPLAFAREAGASMAAPASVQGPTTVAAPPTLPDAPATAEPGEPAADPTGEDPPPFEPEAEPPTPPAPEPAVADAAIVDAAWEGVDGFDVELEIKGGKKMRGRVGAVQRDTFTLIQAETGAVLVLPKSGVLSLWVKMPPPVPSKTGLGALVGGGILTGVSTPIFISGVALLAVCPSCAYIHLPLLIIGAAGIGAGIPLLVRGARRREKYRAILEEHRMSPVVMRTPQGWSGGVRFRF